ncbi:MAG: phage holin family protein [Thioalkalivibrionaceae bacterium]
MPSFDLAELPLAPIAPHQALPLNESVNPAWLPALTALRQSAIEPLLGARDTLSEHDWLELKTKLAAHHEWLARHPIQAIDALAPERIERALELDAETHLLEIVARDLAAETSAATIDSCEKLVRFQRDLVQLLRNFVTFSDFYRGKKAIFQAGTLYLDQRSCELVLNVEDIDRHATMAPFSGCYLIYCQRTRAGEPARTIAAALTGGDVDELMVAGRNGIFYDCAGRDWKATVVRVVEQAVSLRQAFWSPYRKIGRMVEAQIQKLAASKADAIESGAQSSVADASTSIDSGKAPPAPFDIAKFAGIFAAIGLAFGAIGTAVAAIMTGLLSLPWWQIPLVVAGVMMLVSGPAVLMAWLKLRLRNLGPLLDANGWAVNARARINVPFGEALTGLPRLPQNAKRNATDPYAEKKRPWKRWIALVVVAIVLIVVWRDGSLPERLGLKPHSQMFSSTTSLTPPSGSGEPASIEATPEDSSED